MDIQVCNQWCELKPHWPELIHYFSHDKRHLWYIGNRYWGRLYRTASCWCILPVLWLQDTTYRYTYWPWIISLRLQVDWANHKRPVYIWPHFYSGADNNEQNINIIQNANQWNNSSDHSRFSHYCSTKWGFFANLKCCVWNSSQWIARNRKHRIANQPRSNTANHTGHGGTIYHPAYGCFFCWLCVTMIAFWMRSMNDTSKIQHHWLWCWLAIPCRNMNWRSTKRLTEMGEAEWRLGCWNSMDSWSTSRWLFLLTTERCLVTDYSHNSMARWFQLLHDIRKLRYSVLWQLFLEVFVRFKHI